MTPADVGSVRFNRRYMMRRVYDYARACDIGRMRAVILAVRAARSVTIRMRAQ